MVLCFLRRWSLGPINALSPLRRLRRLKQRTIDCHDIASYLRQERWPDQPNAGFRPIWYPNVLFPWVWKQSLTCPEHRVIVTFDSIYVKNAARIGTKCTFPTKPSSRVKVNHHVGRKHKTRKKINIKSSEGIVLSVDDGSLCTGGCVAFGSVVFAEDCVTFFGCHGRSNGTDKRSTPVPHG